MTPSADKTYTPFDGVVATRPLEPSPWTARGTFEPDYSLFERLLEVPVNTGEGAVPTALDIWVAQELRRSGFEEDYVWPRRKQPRVLARELVPVEKAVGGSPSPPLRKPLRGSVSAYVLGEFYVKQIDVLMAHWDRGAELMVSTRTQLTAYGKNLHNRFEEYVGDIRNLRGRFPMAALGAFHAVHSNIDGHGDAWEFTIDMMRKLQTEPNGFDTACLLMLHWGDGVPEVGVLRERTPDDLAPELFFEKLIKAVLDRTPVDFHVKARELAPGYPSAEIEETEA